MTAAALPLLGMNCVHTQLVHYERVDSAPDFACLQAVSRKTPEVTRVRAETATQQEPYFQVIAQDARDPKLHSIGRVWVELDRDTGIRGLRFDYQGDGKDPATESLWSRVWPRLLAAYRRDCGWPGR